MAIKKKSCYISATDLGQLVCETHSDPILSVQTPWRQVNFGSCPLVTAAPPSPENEHSISATGDTSCFCSFKEGLEMQLELSSHNYLWTEAYICAGA